MADSQGAGKPAPKESADQEISWLAARLQEKSTYAGLTVVLSLALPFAAKFVPTLTDANAAQIVNLTSMAGIGIGGLLAILFKDKGSPDAKATLPVPGYRDNAKAVIAIAIMSTAMAARPGRIGGRKAPGAREL